MRARGARGARKRLEPPSCAHEKCAKFLHSIATNNTLSLFLLAGVRSVWPIGTQGRGAQGQ